MSTSLSRAIGALLGLAAGDRNGGPFRMAFRLAQSLIDCQGFNQDDVVRRYYNWFRGPPADPEKAFDTGQVFWMVMRHYANGVSIETASARVLEQTGSAGVNPAHRAPPLSICSAISDEELTSLTASECRITHAHPLSVRSAQLCNLIIRHLVSGAGWLGGGAGVHCAVRLLEMLAGSNTCRAGRQKMRRMPVSEAVTQAQRRDPELIRRALDEISLAELSSDGFAPETLKAALYFVHNHASFSAALAASIEFAGPANYCPVLVGALAGARWGQQEIQPADVAHLSGNDCEKAIELATKLHTP